MTPAALIRWILKEVLQGPDWQAPLDGIPTQQGIIACPQHFFSHAHIAIDGKLFGNKPDRIDKTYGHVNAFSLRSDIVDHDGRYTYRIEMQGQYPDGDHQ